MRDFKKSRFSFIVWYNFYKKIIFVKSSARPKADAIVGKNI